MHKAFDKAAKHVYKKGTFTPDMLVDDDITGLIDELYSTLSGAISYGNNKSEHPELLTELLEATYNFSGFKTFHQMNEVGFILESKESDILTFDQFKEQTAKIDSKYNETYLQTEYQFFSESARMANKWADIELDGDRYDLQYRTTGDDKVREEHRALEGTTLPPSDPFWDRYFPPNGYNCRCTAEQVQKGKYPRSDSSAAMALGNTMTEGKKSIFRFNPGKVKSPYPKNHPYMPTGCGDCNKGLKLAYNPNKEACQACIAIASCAKKPDNSSEAKEWISDAIKKFHTNRPTCGRSIKFAEIPEAITKSPLSKTINKDVIPGLHISDTRIAHALRDAKAKRGATLSEKDIIELPQNIDRMTIYYDKTHNNYQFIDVDKGVYKKYVFGVIKKKQQVKLALITSGVIDKSNIDRNKTIKL